MALETTTMLLNSAMLLCPVALINFVTTTKVQAFVVIACFSLLFTTVISLMKVSAYHKVIAASTYAAVLVSFFFN